MSKITRVYVVVEGQTEQTFVSRCLFPEFCHKMMIIPTLIGKRKGGGGGHVNFDRAKNDIGKHLEAGTDAYVTTMFDYFRIDSDWPGLSDIKFEMSAVEKAETLEQATKKEIEKAFPRQNVHERFLPYFEMHEFEAMLFSDIDILAEHSNIDKSQLQSILDSCGEPEEINGGDETAPSKRLLAMSPSYRKVAMGSSISLGIGIQGIRDKCPNFNSWVTKLESLI